MQKKIPADFNSKLSKEETADGLVGICHCVSAIYMNGDICAWFNHNIELTTPEKSNYVTLQR